MKLADMKSHEAVLQEHLQDPAFRQEWERTGLARAVALQVVQYRADNRLSQSALGRRLGMPQPAIARLEAGEHNPSVDTLMRLSRALGIEFHIDITPQSLALSA